MRLGIAVDIFVIRRICNMRFGKVDCEPAEDKSLPARDEPRPPHSSLIIPFAIAFDALRPWMCSEWWR